MQETKITPLIPVKPLTSIKPLTSTKPFTTVHAAPGSSPVRTIALAPAVLLVLALLLALLCAEVAPRAAMAADQKTLKELQAELEAKTNTLHDLVSQQAAQDRPDTLYSALTPTDAQREAATQGTAAQPFTPGNAGQFSSGTGISLAASVGVGVLLFIVISRLLRKIRVSTAKDDFII